MNPALMLPARFLCLLGLLLGAVGARAFAAADAAERLATAQARVREVERVIAAAALPEGVAPDAVRRSSLGVQLQDYVKNPGNDPARFESTADASRRLLAGESPRRTTPADTSRWLDASAGQLLADVGPLAGDALRSGAENARGLRDVRVTAHLARFHARRLLAAVHLNLFKRGLRLAELVAATYAEKEAVAAWRELVAAAGDHPLADAWRAELKGLQANLKELEEQCCPPDEAVMKEKVWDPAADVGRPVAHAAFGASASSYAFARTSPAAGRPNPA